MTFDSFVDAFHHHFTRNPNECIMLGVDRNRDKLPNPSTAEAQDTIKSAKNLLQQLDTLMSTPLDFDQTLDLDLAKLKLQGEVHHHTYTFNGFTELEQKPSAGDDVGDGIFMLLANDPRPSFERLDNITARLKQVPDFLMTLKSRMQTPVARWVDIDAVKVAELPGLFQTIDDWAAEESYPGHPQLQTARRDAERALKDYGEWLRALPTTTRLHVGQDTAEKIVSLRGIDKSLAEIHELARDFLTDTGALIEELRCKLTQKHNLPPDTTTEALHQELNKRYAVPVGPGQFGEILDRYEIERDRILTFIKERDLFPILDHQDMKLIQTPGFLEPSIPAGAMMSPPAFREGVRTSLVYLTLRDDLLDEHTELTIPSMMIHEGIPGHHLQLATASCHPSRIRRHTDAMEQAEGWTTMLEDYMLDLGYMGDLADEARFCAKREISRIGARVAIDLFFMTGDRSYLDVGIDADIAPADPFVAAGNLLEKVTGFSPGRVQAELNWYSQERGYPLSYLTGNALVWELKRDLQSTQRGKISDSDIDKLFHKIFLESGNMPVTFLRRIFIHQQLINVSDDNA